jgi:trehalose 6-phosphate synthase/phosphatase
MVGLLTDKRVVVASLFLPYTVDFQVQVKKKFIPDSKKQDSVPNLIQSLAQHKQKTKSDDLFDFKEPEHLVQPLSKQQRDEELRKLAPLLSVTTQSRRPSLENAQVFADAPWRVKPCSSGNIGLNNTLYSIQEQLDQLVWVGTLGMPTDPLSERTIEAIKSTFETQYNTYPVMTSDNVFDGHYNQYCKQVIKGVLLLLISLLIRYTK